LINITIKPSSIWNVLKKQLTHYPYQLVQKSFQQIEAIKYAKSVGAEAIAHVVLVPEMTKSVLI
jgi:hypothetical protein